MHKTVQMPDGINKAKVYFRDTQCFIIFGKTNESDDTYPIVGRATIRYRKTHGNIARAHAFDKALKNAIQNAQEHGMIIDNVRVGLTKDEAEYIWNNLSIKKQLV